MPANTIFAGAVFSMENTFLPPGGKNLPTLGCACTVRWPDVLLKLKLVPRV